MNDCTHRETHYAATVPGYPGLLEICLHCNEWRVWPADDFRPGRWREPYTLDFDNLTFPS